MKISNERLFEEIQILKELVRTSIRARKSNKDQDLEIEVKSRKKMNVHQVESHLGCSRPWALSLMKKLGKESFFTFVRGDKDTKRPSFIIYEDALIAKGINDKIEEIMTKYKEISFADLADKLGINNKENWLEEVKAHADNFTKTVKEYELTGNKLKKYI